ncbi:MAG: xanthine dehydrogenase family protein molybdopterin-binding subunit [Dehalococcoidia bacterium]|nr:xanthine dehydrogenase family protein molybdopterin-binding subunit [Dehalococcoidia bacterium]
MATTYAVVGKRVPRVDAVDKATGRSIYGSDIYLPGMLHCKILSSTQAHAKIKKIDFSKALAVPGVKSIITAADVPDIMYGTVGNIRDRSFMARDRVRFIGEPVAAVAAIDEDVAEYAVSLIEVEYEPLPAVFDVLEAMKEGAPLVHEKLQEYEGSTGLRKGNICSLLTATRGDMDAGLSEADFIVEGTYRSQPINQGYMEPMACAAEVEPSGRVTIWTTTQAPYAIRNTIAETLQLPMNRVKVIPLEIGGGFGAKLRVSFEAFCVILSQKTGRPVKMISSREENFTAIGPRLECVATIKTGVKKDGTITARQVHAVYDTGAYLGPGVGAGVGHSTGPYRVPNFKAESYAVYTNKIWAGSYRASGVADMVFAVESHMDEVAACIGMDPFDFRLKNILEEGDRSLTGEVIPTMGLREMGEAAKTGSNWNTRKQEDGWGIGVAFSDWKSGTGASTATVSLNEDGTVSVLTGTVDIAGSDTSLSQIVAETIGVPFEKVVMAKKDTDAAPFNGPTGGSRVIYSAGRTVLQAAQDAKEKVLRLAADVLEANQDDLEVVNERVQVKGSPDKGRSLAEIARLSSSSKYGSIMGQAALSQLPFAPIYNAVVVEIKVDKETGMIKVLNFTQSQDLGFAINPNSVEGQMEGGAVQAIGRALYENFIFDKGKPVNPSLTTYLLPLALDVPPMSTIMIESVSKEGAFGAKAVAEPPGFGAPAAIANALYNATGIRIRDLPLSPDKVRAALKAKQSGS